MCSCEYCHHIPHLPGCPDAPDPEPALTCFKCEEGIMEGDKYLDTEKGPVCKECLAEMDPEEILEAVGEMLSVA